MDTLTGAPFVALQATATLTVGSTEAHGDLFLRVKISGMEDNECQILKLDLAPASFLNLPLKYCIYPTCVHLKLSVFERLFIINVIFRKLIFPHGWSVNGYRPGSVRTHIVPVPQNGGITSTQVELEYVVNDLWIGSNSYSIEIAFR
nr:uncharacterized protein LOC113810072 [Penaeus vannamei]